MRTKGELKPIEINEEQTGVISNSNDDCIILMIEAPVLEVI